MREIVLDTETTGLSPHQGDRIVEIGCVEIFNRFPTGKTYHIYLNPERDMPESAFRVHGLSAEFLKDKPLFTEIADEFLAFVAGDPLVIHNADFDMGFLNMELLRANRAALTSNQIINTLILARRKHPGQSNKLDDLCVRYGIDNSGRNLHGALLDARLLAEVYAELVGGRQAALSLQSSATASVIHTKKGAKAKLRQEPLRPLLTEDEKKAHDAFIASLGSDALWKKAN